MVRPNIDLDEEELELVEQYAQEHGLKRRRAWADLVRAGLESEGVTNEAEA